MPQLFFKEGATQGFYHDIGPGTITIGRSRGCTIELSDRGVSREHASIHLGPDGKAALEDMGSKNGTFLNGNRIEKAILKEGDEIKIGQTLLIYHREQKGASLKSAQCPADNKNVKSTVRSVLSADAMKKIDSEDASGDLALLRKAHKHLAIVYRVGRAISATLNLSELLNAIMKIIFEVIGPDEAFIMLRDDAKGELKLRLFRSKGSTGKEGAVAVSRTILKRVVEERVAVLSADASTDSRFSSAQSVLRYHMMSTMCVPLMREDVVLGVLHVANRSSSGEFHEEDLQLLSGIANQAALAIENAKLYHNIQVEVRRRNNLQRFLSPAAVDQIIDGTRELNLGGEIREVTVLFSDIRDFTKLSEDLPPNEVVGMLNEYFNEMSRIIFKYEGTIDKFIGDAIIVVFGAALQHPDDPLRAVRTAVEMQSSMRTLNTRWEGQGTKTFQIGIGVTTGDVLYGNVGSEQRMELTVIGDTVNFASRLADIAAGGEVLVSGCTWNCLDGSIAGEKTAPMQIHGKAEPVEVYRVRLP
jgi:adenylate cyclase